MLTNQKSIRAKQYSETSDERDAEMISYLVDVLLLHQYSVIPSDNSSIEKRVMTEWCQVGRAMFGQHPYNRRTDDGFYSPICNKCVHYHRKLSKKITCDVYLDRIPSEILTGDETCKRRRLLARSL
jgi:hypothetical protein